MDLISKDLGKGWLWVGRVLSIEDAELDNIRDSHTQLYECSYQMLQSWAGKNGDQATYECLARALLHRANGEMQSIDWHSIFTSDSNPSDMFCSFYSTISEKVDKHIPLKQLSKKELKFQSKPWITQGIKVSIQVKNKFYKKYLKTKSCYFHSKFKLYRNKLNHLLKLSKKQYYSNYFLKNIKDSKRIWNGIKQIIHFKPPTSHRTIKIITNNNVVTDPQMIAEMFNNFFANIGKDLACSIPNVEMSPLEYLKTSFCNSFFISPTTAEEIEAEITKLKSSKATGPFSIPVAILKILKTVVSKPLEVLFNASFETGIVPDNFKLANVIPVFKKGSQTCLSNYRPISLLSVFNKLLEKLMCNRLVNFLEKKKVFFDNQFGFRAKHSTDHAILSIVDKIQRAIDERDFSCGIFLDFSKAFDTINHEILLKKLEFYGIRGIAHQWFSSYLSNRLQTVTVNGVTSNSVNISCGVPQGSVLGPILFLLYINDFHHCSKVFDFHLFADDTNLFCKHKNLTSLQATINNELSNVNSWLCANKLSLNIEKTSFLIFHPPQRKVTFNFHLTLNGKQLQQDSCIKYLGILIDANLSWKPQILCIVKKIKRSVGILSKLRHYVNIDILTNLYYSLIHPFLTYGIIIWGNTYSTTLQPLYILQKKAVRIMTFSSFNEHSTPLFRLLAIMKLSDLVTFHIALIMHKFHNKLLPSYFDSFFNPVLRIHNYNTRSAANQSYYLPRARTNYGIFNIRFQGPKVWNSLGKDIKSTPFGDFKKQFKNELLCQY